MTRTDWTFHNESITTGNGDAFAISFNQNSGGTICVEIGGTATLYTVVFEASGLLGAWHSIYGWDETNKTLIASATDATGKLITFDITAKSAIRMRISTISGGNITVKGKVVD